MTPNEIALAAQIKAAENPVIGEAMRGIWECLADEIVGGGGRLGHTQQGLFPPDPLPRRPSRIPDRFS